MIMVGFEPSSWCVFTVASGAAPSPAARLAWAPLVRCIACHPLSESQGGGVAPLDLAVVANPTTNHHKPPLLWHYVIQNRYHSQ